MDLKEKFGGISRNEVRNFIEQKNEIIKKLDYETLKIDDPKNFVQFLSDNENDIHVGTFNSAKKRYYDIEYSVINSKSEKEVSSVEITNTEKYFKLRNKNKMNIYFPHIETLEVEQNYRGKGIGEMSFGNTLDILQNRLGSVMITLDASDVLIFEEYTEYEKNKQISTREYLTKLIEFYKKFGFIENVDDIIVYDQGAAKMPMFLLKPSKFKKNSVFVYGDGEFSSRPKNEKQGIEIQYRLSKQIDICKINQGPSMSLAK